MARDTLLYPETQVTSSTLHSGTNRRDAVQKALQYLPSFAPEPRVRRAVVEDRYTGNPNDLVI